MQRTCFHSIFAAALLAAAASAAPPQNLTAEIPFAFRVGTVRMAPGTYDISVERGGPTRAFKLHNRHNGANAEVVNPTRREPGGAWVAAGAAKLGFDCVAGQCVLRELWTGDGPSYSLLRTRPPAEAVRTTDIRMTRSAGF